MIDLSLSDLTLRQEFINKFDSDDIDGANSVLTSNEQLKNKYNNSTYMNGLSNNITSLEQKLYDNVDDKLESYLNEQQTNINNFNVVEWDNSTIYNKNNFVLYGNELYYCIVDNTNVVPTTTSNWLHLGLSGNKGNYGLLLQYRGTYNSSENYVEFDLVMYNNRLYVSRGTVTNILPTDNTNWQQISGMNIEQFYVGTQPTNLENNQIWFEEITEVI